MQEKTGRTIEAAKAETTSDRPRHSQLDIVFNREWTYHH